jgi:hypothetical protein
MKMLFKISLRYLVVFLVMFCLIDFFLCRLILHLGFNYDTKEFKQERSDVPYIEFTGKPFELDHNKFGYRGKSISEASDSAIKILFFGGSTGYYGNPTIAQIVENELKSTLHKDIFIANCSVVSSNHNQHLHALVEQFLNYKIDLVIFYGGYNENIQPLYYDPRPGYPFNYYYKHECPAWRLFLIKYSALFGELEKKHRLVSGIKKFRHSFEQNQVKWHQSLADNYFKTLDKANLITTKMLCNHQQKPASFLGFYQPYRVPESYLLTHSELKANAEKSSYLYDISACLDSIAAFGNVYANDDIHLLQEGNVIVAKKMSKIIEESLKLKE